MHPNHLIRYLPPTLLILVSLLTACGSILSPEETADRMLKAMKTGDVGEAKKYVVKEDKARLEKWIPMVIGEADEIEVKSAVINGDEALVIYLDSGVEKELKLIMENGKWKAFFNGPEVAPAPKNPRKYRSVDA